MFGNPGLAAWGSSTWGSILPEPGALFLVDAIAKAEDVERIFAVDALGGLFGAEATFDAEAVLLGDEVLSFGVDFYPAPLPADVFAKFDVAPYILAELLLPTGTVRVAAKCRSALGEVWDGRLVKSGTILRTIGRGTDDLSLTLDDTDTDGQVRFRDLFVTDDPEGSLVNVYLGAEGLADKDHFLVFEGRLEEIQGFSYAEVRLRVVRRESVEDRLLGELVDQAGFPDAPDESISRMLPVTFGQVAAHEGVVTETLGLGTLAVAALVSDTTLTLEDASQFPNSGSVAIEGEQVDYTSRSATELLGATRGAGGTSSAYHAAGAELAELGTFEVVFAGHGLGRLEAIRLELPNGNLGEPVPGPTTVDLPNALATWSEIPKIRDPEAALVYQRVHFQAIGLGNTATDPQFAARENPGYEAFRVARIAPVGSLVLDTNTDGLGQPGDIQRVWLGVIFDPKDGDEPERPLFNTSATISGVTFGLQPTDIVPDSIARNDERTGDRYYDVPAPEVNIAEPAEQGAVIVPKDIVHAGMWVYQAIAGRVVDEDESTEAVYMFTGVGEAVIVGVADAVFRVPEDSENPVPTGATAKSAKLVFVAGWEKTPFSSHFDVYLRRNGKEIEGTRFKACTLAPSGFCSGLIEGRERFEHPIDPALFATIDSEVEWVIHPAAGVSNGLWVGVELWAEGTFSPAPPDISVEQDARFSVTNYFEVTDLLGVQASPGGALVRDWAWFDDVDQGGRVIFFFAGVNEARIIETFLVVEYRPFAEAGTQVPRVFANVEGLVPSGDPIAIARELVTGAPPLGLGLPSSRVSGTNFATADSLLSDGVRADFAVYQQRGILDLISELSDQTDTRETWEQGVHRIARRPRADTSLPVTLDLGTCDLLTDKRLGIKRSNVRRVVNLVSVKWRVYAPTGETSRAEDQNDAASQAKFGTQDQVLELRLLADDAAAALVAARKLERLARPRWVLEFDSPIYAMNLKLGDLVGLTSRDFSFEVGEVTQVSVGSAGLKRAQVQVAVWHQG